MKETYQQWLDRMVREAHEAGEFDRLGTAKVVHWRSVVK